VPAQPVACHRAQVHLPLECLARRRLRAHRSGQWFSECCVGPKLPTSLRPRTGLVAGGSGLTPMLQVLAAVLAPDADPRLAKARHSLALPCPSPVPAQVRLSLVLSVHTADDVVMRDHIERLVQVRDALAGSPAAPASARPWRRTTRTGSKSRWCFRRFAMPVHACSCSSSPSVALAMRRDTPSWRDR